jgi:hypothetical protein
MKRSLIALSALAAAGCAVASSRRDYDEQARGHELRTQDAGGLMATTYGTKAKAPAMMPADGRAVMLIDKYAVPASGFADADQINLVRIPAGMEVGIVQIQSADLDSAGSPEILFRVGYAPCNSSSSLSADDDYFAAAGQTTAQAGGRLNCSFPPIRFEEDVWLTVTVNTDAATDAAGNIYGIVVGSANGPSGSGTTAAI